MIEIGDSDHALFALVEEVSLLNGRFKTAFANVRKSVALGETEMTVLSSVVRAAQPLTVPQIGRSLGIARQLVQRAANALCAQRLVEATDNPDHKKAMLLIATARGRAVKMAADKSGNAIVARLEKDIDPALVKETAIHLHAIRKILEQNIRTGESG
jgi:DNA-binding MarR family transcriptional regulator